MKKSGQFADLVDEIPLYYFEMTKEIVQLAQNAPYPLNSTIYLTLSDHLHFAVERQQRLECDESALLGNQELLYRGISSRRTGTALTEREVSD